MFQRAENDLATPVSQTGREIEVIHLTPEEQLALAREIIEDAPAKPLSDFALRILEEYRRTVTSL